MRQPFDTWVQAKGTGAAAIWAAVMFGEGPRRQRRMVFSVRIAPMDDMLIMPNKL